eukprot:5066716-Pyramimonas_sp.AAC.1
MGLVPNKKSGSGSNDPKMCNPLKTPCKNVVIELLGPTPKKPNMGKPRGTSNQKRFLGCSRPRPTEPPMGRPLRTSCGRNGFP